MMDKQITLALVGDPNSGKTTLFNALTGCDQRIGNWPGVTVEKKEGFFRCFDKSFQVIDLPGTYTLDPCMSEGLDEQVTLNYLENMDDGVILNVVDASHLERHLYLTTQLLERGLPLIVVLTMNDRLPKGALDVAQLEQQLGVPVVTVQAHKNQEISNLCHALKQPLKAREPLNIETDPTLEGVEDRDILLADARYEYVQNVCNRTLHLASNKKDKLTKTIDKWVLNRFLGLPIFLLVMYTMFLLSINVGGVFQDFFDQSANVIFVDGTAHLLKAFNAPDFIIAIVAYGFGKGVNTILTFVPVIASLFFFMAFIEGSGYMARAAFVMDRVMRSIGLPGKAFVPLIIGFGCNVPSVMATRTLDTEKDRILAALMSPFMSCSARLAIFTVFVSIFFPVGGHNIIFALYLIGILVAILTGLFLKNTLLDCSLSVFLMELPAYHLPNLKGLILQTWGRLHHFLLRAGRIIVPMCVVLGVCSSLSITTYGIHLTLNPEESILAWFGHLLSPLFSPMGMGRDNWPAVVGLLTGTLAKEVVIATLNTLYIGLAGLHFSAQSDFAFWQGLYQALQTVPEKLSVLSQALMNPILASSPDQTLSDGAAIALKDNFSSRSAVFAYLIFILLYVPCVSTMAAIRKELSQFWMVFSIIWSTGIAYATATLSYQLLTFDQHVLQSLFVTTGFIALFFLVQTVVKNKLAMPDNTAKLLKGV